MIEKYANGENSEFREDGDYLCDDDEVEGVHLRVDDDRRLRRGGRCVAAGDHLRRGDATERYSGIHL